MSSECSDPFHQMETVELKLGRICQPGEINRVLKKLGYVLHYDVYSLPRQDDHPIWQSDNIVNVTMLMNGEEVDAQDACDQIDFSYPLATLDSRFIGEFVRAVINVKGILSGTLHYKGSALNDPGSLVSCFEDCVSDLMKTWGEEPGSKALRVLIETNR